MTNISDVLLLLSRGDAPDRKYPDGKGEYWALCPYHNDTRSGSFSVSERGFRCFSCGAEGSLAMLTEKLTGYAPDSDYYKASKKTAKPKQYKEPEGPPVSLSEYAQIKKLPIGFLSSLGMKTSLLWGRNVVEIPYLGWGGELLRSRYRLSMSGPKHERFRWAKGEGVYLYGLWRLPLAGSAIVVVEGESDAQTLWWHGVPAVGVPGAASWRAAWAKHLDGLMVYAWKEPDAAGEGFINKLAAVKPIVIESTWKDVSECHVATGKLPKEVTMAVKVSKWKRSVVCHQ